MAKKVNYRQCHLKKKDGTHVWEQVSWIPEPYCVVGKVLKLRDSDGNWDDGWKVVSAGSHVQSEQEVNTNSRQHLKHRLATDI